MGNFISGATDLALYTSIRDYIYARIEFLTEQILSKNLSIALAIVLTLLTIWIMMQGFLIVTGRSQEGLKGFLFNLGKSYLIILVALGVASNSQFAVRTLTDNLADAVSEIMTDSQSSGSACLTKNNPSFIGCKIDKNLTLTQSIMGYMNSIDTANNEILENKIEKAKWFAGAGSAGPAIIAGTMLIMYRIAMSLFIGFAPLFILSLLFKKTAPLFQKWLYYGIATIFSSVLLAVMADIATDLTGDVAASLFILDKLTSLVTNGDGAEGVMQAATQQLGLGLILSTLLITVPPMAGMWFHGVMGNFNAYSPLTDRWNNNNPTTAGTGNPAHDTYTNNHVKNTSDYQQNNSASGKYTQPFFSQTPNSTRNTQTTDMIKQDSTRQFVSESNHTEPYKKPLQEGIVSRKVETNQNNSGDKS